MSTPFLASDVMDSSAALLNDNAKTQFTYAAQLPYLRIANEKLENLMIACGVSIQRQVSTVMTVNSSTVNIDLSALVGYPSDMLLPIRLWEKGASDTTFRLMDEKDWEPETIPGSSLTYWTFRNNKIFTTGVIGTRQVKIDYWRELTAVTSQNSNEEIGGSKTYLSAKTAELVARYVGQNAEIADSLLDNEVSSAQDLLERIYIKNSQGSRSRRRRFTRPTVYYSR